MHELKCRSDQIACDLYRGLNEGESTSDNNYTANITQSLFDHNDDIGILSAKNSDGYGNVNNVPSLHILFTQQNIGVEDECCLHVKSIDEVCDRRFFQLYATKKGYCLTESFLSSMNKYKMNFIDVVDNALSVLDDSFNFLRDSLSGTVTNLEDEVLSFISRYKLNFRPDCISILQSDFIPSMVKSISEGKVVYCNNDIEVEDSTGCEMKCLDMERFFLYSVSVLESILMIKEEIYYRNFFDKNKIFLLSFPNVSCSDSFIYAASNDGSGTPKVVHPVSLSSRFGVCISFMASYKIDCMVSAFIDECSFVLKNIVSSKYKDVHDYGYPTVRDLKKLRAEILNLIEEEFYKNIFEKSIAGKLNDFLTEIIICNQHDISTEDDPLNRLLLRDKIISYMHGLVYDRLTSDNCIVLGDFRCKLERSKNYLLKVESIGRADKVIACLSNLHPDDSSKISFMRKKFFSNVVEVVMNKFYKILEEKYVFSDGTIIRDVSWSKVAKEIHPIIQEEVRPFVDEELNKISQVLSKSRIVESSGSACGNLDFSGSFRDVTLEEKKQIMSIISNFFDVRLESLFRKSWRSLIKIRSKNCISGYIGGEISELSREGLSNEMASSTLPAQSTLDGNFSSVVVDLTGEAESSSSADLGRTSSSTVRLGKVTNTWGLNLCPDDRNMILLARRRFLSDIRIYVRGVFFYMLERKHILPDSSVLSESPWNLVSSYLLPIALKSVKSIINCQYMELDCILSKCRVVVYADSQLFCNFRRITDYEKNNIRIISKKYLGKELRKCIRLSWLDVLGSARRNLKLGTVELLTSIRLGLNISKSDNVDILNIRNGFLSKIGDIIYDKFYEIINDRHTLKEGGFTNAKGWSEVSSILLPIARKEIKSLVESEHRFIEGVLSRARVIVDYVNDRKITDDEISAVLENIRRWINIELVSLASDIWNSILSSTKGGSFNTNMRNDGVVDLCNDDSELGLYDCIPDEFVKFGNLYIDKDHVRAVEARVESSLGDARDVVTDLINGMHKSDYLVLDFYDLDCMMGDEFRSASGRVLSKFMDELDHFLSDFFVWDDGIRIISDEEKRNLLKYVYVYVSGQHDQIVSSAKLDFFSSVLEKKHVC